MSYSHAGMEVPAEDIAQVEIDALQHGLAARNLHGDQALAFVVEQMRQLTCATAAVIALPDEGEIVCRASSGNAPAVGARVDPDSGLSGECVRTGRLVRCDDTEADPRVDRLLCRGLQLRSILIVPVTNDGHPAGVLEVFSSQPNAFHASHQLFLQNVAGLVAAIAAPQPAPVPPLSPHPETTAPAVKIVPPPPQVEEEPAASTQQASTGEKQAQQPPPSAPTATAEPGDQPPETAADPEPPAEIAQAASLASPAPAPQDVQIEMRPAAALSEGILSAYAGGQPRIRLSSSITTFARVAAQRFSTIAAQRFPSFRIRIAVVGLLLMLLLVVAWPRRRTAASPSSAPMNVQLKHDQPAPAPARPAPALLLASNATADQDTADEELVPSKPAIRAPAITFPPPDLTNSSGPPVLTQLARSTGQPPAISGLLEAPVAAPRLVVPEVSQMSGGKLIRKVDPVYPSGALGMHGKVVLKATINPKGRVARVQIVSGQTLLAQAAVAAVTRWRYQPSLLNGVPIEREHDIVIDFKAPGQ